MLEAIYLVFQQIDWKLGSWAAFKHFRNNESTWNPVGAVSILVCMSREIFIFHTKWNLTACSSSTAAQLGFSFKFSHLNECASCLQFSAPQPQMFNVVMLLAHLCTAISKSFETHGAITCPSDRHHHKTRFPIFRATWFREYFARFP